MSGFVLIFKHLLRNSLLCGCECCAALVEPVDQSKMQIMNAELRIHEKTKLTAPVDLPIEIKLWGCDKRTTIADCNALMPWEKSDPWAADDSFFKWLVHGGLVGIAPTGVLISVFYILQFGGVICDVHVPPLWLNR